MSTPNSSPKENVTDNLTDAPASQPEVTKRWKEDVTSDQKPSQAEGDRETVEADLEQKGYENND